MEQYCELCKLTVYTCKYRQPGNIGTWMHLLSTKDCFVFWKCLWDYTIYSVLFREEWRWSNPRQKVVRHCKFQWHRHYFLNRRGAHITGTNCSFNTQIWQRDTELKKCTLFTDRIKYIAYVRRAVIPEISFHIIDEIRGLKTSRMIDELRCFLQRLSQSKRDVLIGDSFGGDVLIWL